MGDFRILRAMEGNGNEEDHAGSADGGDDPEWHGLRGAGESKFLVRLVDAHGERLKDGRWMSSDWMKVAVLRP